MTALVAAVVLVIALLVGVAVADPFLARLAERRASLYLTASLGAPATVRVHGSPFLTQAIRGRYRAVEVSADGVQLARISGAALQAHLVNAYLPLRDLLGRRAGELSVAHLHGRVVLPYAELARLSPVPGLALHHRDGRLRVTAALPIPGISQLARISGEAVVSITDAGGVWLRVRDVSVAGIAVPSIVLNQILPSLAFPIPLPPLPFGIRIEYLTPTADGLQASGSAGAVAFRRPSHPTG